ncbi:MAG: hypothetical protein ACRDQ1_16235 [Sciscionella sp.]
MTGHAVDNKTDRDIGEQWEGHFCRLAAEYGKVLFPNQISRPGKSAAAFGKRRDGTWEKYTLPDVTIFSAPGEHHEIKHKNRTRDGAYGWEQYRLSAAVRWANTTGQRVYYTIHDWELAGASSSSDEVMRNHIDDWVYADVEDLCLDRTYTRICKSYYNSGTREFPTDFWAAGEYFRPLKELWVPGLRVGP